VVRPPHAKERWHQVLRNDPVTAIAQTDDNEARRNTVAMTDLPDDVPMVFREFRTAEMSTLGSEGQPLTLPALSEPLVPLLALAVLNALIRRGHSANAEGAVGCRNGHLRYPPSLAQPSHLERERRRHDAAQTVERLSARLRDQMDLDTLTSDLQTVVRETLQPASVSVWLRREGRGP
jgi:hypothetical protein